MSGVVADLLVRQRMLTRFGLGLLALTPLALAAQLVDPRDLAGVNVWVKPAKFLFSIGLYALTTAWFFGYVRPERRGATLLRVTATLVLIGGGFEAVYITLQAARGLDSHFNVSSPLYMVMYALMGLFAMLLVGASLPLAWEIARRPKPGVRPDFVAALVIALVMTFVFGGGLGAYLSSQAGHAVGAVGGHVPLVGWNRAGGDLRVAHFFGIHAQQAIPLLACMVGAAGTRARWVAIVAGSAIYAGFTIVVFAQSLAGRALLPG